MDIRLADRTDGIQAAVELYVAFGVRSIFASARRSRNAQKSYGSFADRLAAKTLSG
jgi:two-component system, response regulator PdtaR